MKSKIKPALFAVYGRALRLFPFRFRLKYKDQLLQTLSDAYSESSLSPARFWLRAFVDLLTSSLRERIVTMQQQILKRPILFHAVGLALILTVLGGASAIAIQQLLRRGANQPQIHMSDLYGAKISSGTGLELALPAAHLDLEQALEPFIIFYDDETRPERATGFLNGETPKPPPGVFNYLRTHETDTLTWQPKTGVRIAAVIRRIAGPHPGFLLVGRSLRVVEEQESFLRMMVIFGWLAVMVIIALGATLLLRAERLRLSSERFA